MKSTEKKGIEILSLSKEELVNFAQYFKDNQFLKEKHIILDLLTIKDLQGKDLEIFVKISKEHNKKNKKSVVLVNDEITYSEIPNEVNLTPTLQEAYDIIEMEDIQRDLGF